LVEALPEVGGYKVHADKIRRLGVPIWTRHSVVRAHGRERVEAVTIAQLDDRFRPVAGTERTYAVDTLLIAVGLSPCDELLESAKDIGLKVYAAGDTAEIAEASAAIFSGRIMGRQIATDLGVPVEIPRHWPELAETLRSRPGPMGKFEPVDLPQAVHPLIRCVQEIPCDPCREACPEHLISLQGGTIMNLPKFEGSCLGCGRCVSVCPGLAINLVINDYDPSGETSLLMLPFEFGLARVPLGSLVDTVDFDGQPGGKGTVIAVREWAEQNHRHLLLMEVPARDKLSVAGFRIRAASTPLEESVADESPDDPIVCRCERVRTSTIVGEIRAGVRDMNQLKALARSGMGGCGGKTCTDLIRRIFREEGVDLSHITAGTTRPLVAETPLEAFVHVKESNHD